MTLCFVFFCFSFFHPTEEEERNIKKQTLGVEPKKLYSGYIHLLTTPSERQLKEAYCKPYM